MSIEIKLDAKIDDIETYDSFISTVKNICELNHLPFRNDEDYSEIHICEEGKIYITLEEDLLNITTTTNAIGPGYHVFVDSIYDAIISECDSIEFIKFDDTRYNENKNFNLLQSNFDLYLSEVIKNAIKYKEEGLKDIAINWPSNYYMPFEKEGYIISNMGYLSIEQISRLDIKDISKQYYIWYEKDIDASFYVKQAINVLWKECYFEASNSSETTYDITKDILFYIEKAYELNPSEAIPFEQYQQLCKLIDYEAKITNANDLGLHSIGYRKEKVKYNYGDWLIPLDGISDINYDDNTLIVNPAIINEDDIWKYTAYFSGYSFDKSIDDFMQFNIEGKVIEEISNENNGYKYKGYIYEQIDIIRNFYVLTLQIINDKNILMININYSNIEDSKQFIDMINSITLTKVELH